ncbi:hypothetical protein D3C75_487730 [compost metagenome]
MVMNIIFKEQIRKWGTGMMAAGLLLGGGLLPAEAAHAAPAAAQAKALQSSVVLKWNGVITPQTGIYSGGKVWVPVSFLRDSLKMPVTYDQTEKTYSIGKGNTLTKLMVSDYSIAISVNNYFLGDYEAKNINNRLYIPFDLMTDYLGYQGDWSASAGRLNIMKQKQNAISINTESFIKESEDAPIRLDYPQVSGLANADAQKKINDMIKQQVLSYAADAEKQIANKSEDDRPYEFQGGYVVTYNKDGVLSLVTEQYGYTGGAHGMTYRNAFTFSLKDGKRLLIGDLLKANPNYKKELNAKLAKQIKAEGGYLGGFTGLNSEKYFYLKDGKLVVFFQLYEYTAYASGFPQFTFTFKELLPDGSSPFATLK